MTDHRISCECKLYSYRKTKDGLVVAFVIHPNEMPDALALAPIGTRYGMALVEIGDDETAKEVMPAGHRNSTEADTLPVSAPATPGRAKRPFASLPLPQQAGMLCSEPTFVSFLREKWHSHGEIFPEQTVRRFCGVQSRSAILPETNAGDRWRELVSGYRAWMKEAEVV